MRELVEIKCVACKKGAPQVSPDELAEFIPQIPDWKIVEHDGIKRLVRVFIFPDFCEALEFTNRVGQLAEAEDHHPDLIVKYGSCRVVYSTHSIGGLSENDFICAKKIDNILA